MRKIWLLLAYIAGIAVAKKFGENQKNIIWEDSKKSFFDTLVDLHAKILQEVSTHPKVQDFWTRAQSTLSSFHNELRNTQDSFIQEGMKLLEVIKTKGEAAGENIEEQVNELYARAKQNIESLAQKKDSFAHLTKEDVSLFIEKEKQRLEEFFEFIRNKINDSRGQ